MNQIPDWWLVATGVASIVFVLLIAGLIYMVMTLIKLVRELQQPVATLVSNVNELVPTVKSLVVKVEELTVKVEGIADSTRGTVDLVGEKTRNVVTAVEAVSAAASQQLQRYAPMLGTVLTAVRLFNAFREYRNHNKPKVRVEASKNGGIALELDSGGHKDGEHKAKKGKVNEHRGVEQSGSSSGS